MAKTLALLALALGLALPTGLAMAREKPSHRHPHGMHVVPHSDARLRHLQRVQRQHDLSRPWGGRPRRPMRSM